MVLPCDSANALASCTKGAMLHKNNEAQGAVACITPHTKTSAFSTIIIFLCISAVAKCVVCEWHHAPATYWLECRSVRPLPVEEVWFTVLRCCFSCVSTMLRFLCVPFGRIVSILSLETCCMPAAGLGLRRGKGSCRTALCFLSPSRQVKSSKPIVICCTSVFVCIDGVNKSNMKFVTLFF